MYRKNLLAIVSIILVLSIFFMKQNSMKIKLPRGRESTLVCFGDSLTAGIGAKDGRGYPDYLKNYIDIEIINSGVPGDTTSQARKRFERDVMDYDPDIVIIELGANDYFGGISSEKTKVDLEYMVDELLNNGTIVFIAKFFPEKSIVSFIKPSDKKRYDKMYKELSSKENVFLIEDIWKDVWSRPKYMSDRVHPNEIGYEIMAEQYFNSMKTLFKYNGLLKEKISH